MCKCAEDLISVIQLKYTFDHLGEWTPDKEKDWPDQHRELIFWEMQASIRQLFDKVLEYGGMITTYENESSFELWAYSYLKKKLEQRASL